MKILFQIENRYNVETPSDHLKLENFMGLPTTSLETWPTYSRPQV